MELKVGKKVRVRNDLVAGKYYDGLYMDENMMQFCGNIYTIVEMVRPNKYSISDISHWIWNDKMLEEAEEEIKEQPNYIIINDTICVGDLAIINQTPLYTNIGDIGLVVRLEEDYAFIGFTHKLKDISGNWDISFPAKPNQGFCIEINKISRVCMSDKEREKLNLPPSIDYFL